MQRRRCGTFVVGALLVLAGAAGRPNALAIMGEPARAAGPMVIATALMPFEKRAYGALGAMGSG